MRRRALFWLCAVSLVGGARALACSSFEPSAEDGLGDAAPEGAGETDACPSCGKETGAADAGADASDPVLEVSAGGSLACARRASKTVVCWGRDNEGQLGQPTSSLPMACNATTKCRPMPIEVPGLTDVTHVSVGRNFACARTSANNVKCWGENTKGTLGLGTNAPATRSSPADVPGLPPALDVASGGDNACARVTVDGGTEVYCWGTNDFSLVGPGANGNFGARRIAGLTGATSVALDLSGQHACAILADKTVACWGHNGYSCLGHDINTTSDLSACPVAGANTYCNPTPKLVAVGAFTASEIAVGHFFACAREASSGLVSCWGFNGLGGLGQGAIDQGQHPVPVVVPGLGPASAVAARGTHACAIVAGSVYCWGDQVYGELGNGNQSDDCGTLPCKSVPQQVTALAGAVRISVGFYFSVAQKADGATLLWGANGDGRLGHAPGQSNDLATCSPMTGSCNPVPQPLVFP